MPRRLQLITSFRSNHHVETETSLSRNTVQLLKHMVQGSCLSISCYLIILLKSRSHVDHILTILPRVCGLDSFFHSFTSQAELCTDFLTDDDDNEQWHQCVKNRLFLPTLYSGVLQLL